MPDYLNVIYVVALLAVYLGEKWQQVNTIRILRDALDRAQAAAVAPPAQAAPATLPAPPVAPAALPAPKAPAPAGPFGDFPKWFQLAAREIGNREEGDNRGP